MFENIIGQDDIIERLREDIRARQLPSAMLFAGPEYSGKLSTALELARILTCTRNAEWSCSCQSCNLNRELINPRIQLLGTRYFVQEILTSGETLKYTTTRGTAYLYLRAVRKLLRRIDPVLWEGEEQRLSKALEGLAATEEALEPIARVAAGQQEHDSELPHHIDSARDASFKTLAAMPPDLVPVATVRRLTGWLHGSSEGSRAVIIENVDQLGDASINALLKMLEEPPQDCWFILTTSRRGAVLPTIRSRVRDYRFRERPAQVASEVIRRVFRGPSDYEGSIRDYFLQQEFPGTGSLRSHAEHFLEFVIATSDTQEARAAGEYGSGAPAGAQLAQEGKAPVSRAPASWGGDSTVRREHAVDDALKQVVQALSEVPEREALRHFLQELLKLLGEVLRVEEGSHRDVISRARLASWRNLVQEHYERSSRLNMRFDLLLHSLYYRMRNE